MNFLAHLWLAGEDEGLRLGAMLGDFVKGKRALEKYGVDVSRGIMLHRHIDTVLDTIPAVHSLRESFPEPFRRYGGIITDLAYDHELARQWDRYSDIALTEFDHGVRHMLAKYQDLVPPGLSRFMRYADRRGLFAAYAGEAEVLRSLAGIGRRLSRPNPLHRTEEIWQRMKPQFALSFEEVFPLVQSDVSDWLNDKSTITGS
jgi:acyl carrier protein phosphodiesterase